MSGTAQMPKTASTSPRKWRISAQKLAPSAWPASTFEVLPVLRTGADRGIRHSGQYDTVTVVDCCQVVDPTYAIVLAGQAPT